MGCFATIGDWLGRARINLALLPEAAPPDTGGVMNLTVILVFLGLALVGFVWSALRLRRQQPECVAFSAREVVVRVVLAVAVMGLLALAG